MSAITDNLFIIFSAPIEKNSIDLIVRQITAALPLGCTLSDNARRSLATGPQPKIVGLASSKLEEKDFLEAFEIACFHAREEIGVRLVVEQNKKARISLKRDGQIIRARKRKIISAEGLLYGKRRG